MPHHFAQFLKQMLDDPRPPRLRLAPTPSGFLHLGNAVNFVLNYLCARMRPDGRLLLRIDDLDVARKRPEYVQHIFDTLQWLGLDYDEGPRDAASLDAEWSQQHRMYLYEALLERLVGTGLVFASVQSRRALSEQAIARPGDTVLPLDTPDAAWRIRTPDGMELVDVVLRRRDGIPAYQVANIADDVHFGITHLVRGADLEPSTQVQRWLAGLIDETAFLNIGAWHHPLLTDARGAKLSKSAGAAALPLQADHKISPAHVFQATAHLLELPQEIDNLNDLLSCCRAAVDLI
jgi:glutamyl-tRNA synthetase